MRPALLIPRLLVPVLLLCASAAEAGSYKFVTLVFPPLEYADDKGQAAGAAVELVREVMTRLGHKVEIEVLPWTRSLNLTKEGKADAIFTAYRNDERATFLDYSSEVLIPQVVSLYARKGSGKTFKGDLAELAGQSIGILNTISYGEIFDKAKDQLKLKTERVESLDLNFKKLAAGRIDFVISNRYSAQVEIEALKLEGVIEELDKPVEVTPSYIAFSKKNKLLGLRDQFDAKLREVKKSGRYREILEKFRVRVPKD